MSSKRELPLFMQEENTSKIIKEVISLVPKNSQLYLVGGRMRNALYYKFFGRILPSRDYDLVLIGDEKKLIDNFKKNGWIEGNISRERNMVLKKPKVLHPKNISDYVVLDLNYRREKSIRSNLEKYSNFTFNCSALNIKYSTHVNWYDKIIVLDKTIKDLKSKKIKLNASSHPSNLYAVIRFMHLGFKKPPKKDLLKLLTDAKELDEERFERNIKKVYDYVGGEKIAKKLAKELKLKIDIFNFSELQGFVKTV